jgi:butyryl-CoA dehydrogenase
MPNPLLRDRDVDFLLYELLDAPSLCAWPAFAEHSRETFDLYLGATRRLAREVLYPAYRAMDAEPPRFEGGRVRVHPALKTIYPQLVALEVGAATRPREVGGQQLPLTVATLAHAYLMAANLAAYAYVGLSTGAAHLIETFGNDTLKRDFMDPLYRGEWTGTMALTEPQAGSSLADVKTRATKDGDFYRIKGSKIFISGGDHDLTENVVHLALGRIDGAPAGIKGVSLFAIPRRRREGAALVDNDVAVAGMIHKIGWRGLPSLAIEFGEHDDCRGFLVGEPNRGIAQMFQMMNEARLMVGCNGVATASVAYHEALEYARVRPQGRPAGAKDPAAPQVPIIEHADVRRMLLRQKAIVEGGLALVAVTAREADRAAHAPDEAERRRAALLLDLLTPIAKSFPAEKGAESNALAIQIHGGYGYSSEFLPEAWWRDQKLNSIHEGTTGIQGLDLLGRKAIAQGGAPLVILRDVIAADLARAERAGIDPDWRKAIEGALQTLESTTAKLAGFGLSGELDAMLAHSTDYLELCSLVVVGWLWLAQATLAREALDRGAPDGDFYRGKLAAAQYFIRTEVPRAVELGRLCREFEDSYAKIAPDCF